MIGSPLILNDPKSHCTVAYVELTCWLWSVVCRSLTEINSNAPSLQKPCYEKYKTFKMRSSQTSSCIRRHIPCIWDHLHIK